MQEVLFLPQRQGALDNAAVKWAVMTYGGVDAAAYFHTRQEDGNWNASTSSYYSDTVGELNHHILCVGWDDTYKAANFLPGRRPPGDGAFLIKNSWGTDWGGKMKGYCWVSYYDASFGRALAVFNGVASARDYDAIYQYDALGRSAWVGAGGGGQAWYANRFTSAGSGTVAAASFYTPVPGTSYEVRVARTLRGVAEAPVAATGAIAVGGYHTVRLQQPVAVTTGDPFVVAVRVTTPGWTRPVPVEAPSDMIAPRARAGQSYRERRRLLVDRPDRPHDAARRRARERVPEGVRERGRGRRHPAAARGAPRRHRASRRQGRRSAGARRPGLLQRQRDPRAQYS